MDGTPKPKKREKRARLMDAGAYKEHLAAQAPRTILENGKFIVSDIWGRGIRVVLYQVAW